MKGVVYSVWDYKDVLLRVMRKVYNSNKNTRAYLQLSGS
jgi:hypothetical protein